MNYPGSKGGAGVWQRIISLMPRHENYLELFLGHGAIMLRKRPAPQLNLGNDIDPTAIKWWGNRRGLELRCECALRILSSHAAMMDPNTLVYLDPPYLRSVRTRLFYTHEFAEHEDHWLMLCVARMCKCMVMISGYPSELYRLMLPDWRMQTFRAMTRGGARTECVWMNFADGRELHDTRFVGNGFRERERINRKRDRWVRRLCMMPMAERQVIREALALVDRPSP